MTGVVFILVGVASLTAGLGWSVAQRLGPGHWFASLFDPDRPATRFINDIACMVFGAALVAVGI